MTNLKHIVFVLIIPSILSCKVGVKYTRPENRMPDEFRGQISKKDSANAADVSWRQFFNDPLLIALIDTALTSNLELAINQKQVGILHEELLQRKANYFPSLAMGPQVYGENFSVNRYSGPNSKYYENGAAPPDFMFVGRRQYLFSLRSSWEIDIWGRLKRLEEGSLARLASAEESVKALKTFLVSEVAISYYSLLMLDEQLKVAQTNLKLNDSTINVVELQYRSGQATSLAVQQTENQKLLAASLIPRIEGEIMREENYLRELLGQYPASISRSSAIGEIDFNTNLLAGTPIELLRNRPDIVRAEYNVMTALANTNAARAARYPTLALVAESGLDSQLFGLLFNPAGSLFATFSSSLLQPVFQNRRLKTAQKVAEIDNDIALDQYQLTILTAVREISDEIITIQKLEEEYGIARERIRVSNSAVNNASMLFKSGLANYLEVLNAQSNALSNELNLVNIRMSLFEANISLYRKLGGGWN
jgi:multidrug efflux system outer membrane protein